MVYTQIPPEEKGIKHNQQNTLEREKVEYGSIEERK